MKITINGIEYTSPAPKTGLWFDIKKMRSAQKKRIADMQAALDKINPYNAKETLTDEEIKESNALVSDCNFKIDDNKRILMEEKISIIVKAFDNPNVTKETILDHLLLGDVAIKFNELDNELEDIVAGRMAQFPNDEAARA